MLILAFNAQKVFIVLKVQKSLSLALLALTVLRVRVITSNINASRVTILMLLMQGLISHSFVSFAQKVHIALEELSYH